MKELLIQLLSYLSLGGFPTPQEFNNPLDDKIIHSLLLNEFENVPDVLVTLYSWKNGQSYPHPKSKLIFLFDNGILLPLEEAIIHSRELKKMDVEFKDMLPLFTSGGGEYYLFKMNGQDYGEIFYYSPGEYLGEPVKAFSNLKSLFESVVECYKKGVYKFDGSKWKKDFNSQKEIMKRLNPHCLRWE